MSRLSGNARGVCKDNRQVHSKDYQKECMDTLKEVRRWYFCTFFLLFQPREINQKGLPTVESAGVLLNGTLDVPSVIKYNLFCYLCQISYL